MTHPTLLDSSFVRWIPFWTPAIGANKYSSEANSYELDTDLLMLRTAKCALVAIAVFVAAVYFPSVAMVSYVFAPLMFASISFPFLDSWLSDKVMDYKAVDEYLDFSQPPSRSATRHIQRTYSALQLLIEQAKADGRLPQVLDRCEDFLAEHIVRRGDFDCFKLLLTTMALVPYSLLQQAVEAENSCYLEFILQEMKPRIAEFTAGQQVTLWTCIGSCENARLLRSYGFSLDVQDTLQHTPLMRLELLTREDPSHFRPLSIATQVNILIECGADPTRVTTRENSNKAFVAALRAYTMRRALCPPAPVPIPVSA